MLKENECYIGGVQRFSTEDGPGIRTTVFFKGCPLRCAWCHNPELISPDFFLMYKKEKCIKCGRCIRYCPQEALYFADGMINVNREKCNQCMECVEQCCSEALYTKSVTYTLEQIMEEIEKDSDFFKTSGGGVTFSGGEVLMHAGFVYKIAKMCRERGISVAVDTCGYGKYEDLYRLAEIADVILYDLKHMDREKHKALTGHYPDLIWNNLRGLCESEETREKIIIRVPFIKDINDDWKNLEEASSFMKENKLKKINILPYHAMGISKGREVEIQQQKFETPSDEYLEEVRRFFEAQNIDIVIMGNEQN